MASQVKTVMCIDDDKDILRLNKQLLESTGNYKVQCFTSAKEALQSVSSSMPDLILLDMVMPEMDGIAVLEKLKSNPATRPIPVLFMTAQKSPSDVKKYMDLGAVSVIHKPIDLEDFPFQMEMLSKIILNK